MSQLKTSFDAIKRSPFQAIAAIAVLAVTFFVGTIITILVYSSSQVLTYFETRPQVIAFLKQDSKEDAINALKNKLEKDERIKEVKYISKEDALDFYKSATIDAPLLGELVSPSIFPASLEFSVVDLETTPKVIEEIQKEAVVESVGFTASVGGQSKLSEVIDRLKKIILYIRIGGLGLALTLGFSSFLVLMIVIGMRITTKRADIETLRLIGATSGFIRAPILFEAFLYAFIGTFIGWIFAVILVLYATPSILNYFGAIPVLPRDMMQFFGLLGALFGVELLIALLIAFVGSSTAVSRAIGNK